MQRELAFQTGRIDDLEEQFDDLQAIVNRVINQVNRLSDRVDDLTERVIDLDTKLSNIDDAVNVSVDDVLDEIQNQGFLQISDQWAIGEFNGFGNDFVILDTLDEDNYYRFFSGEGEIEFP